MSSWVLRCIFLCLSAGAALGCLFLLLKLVRILLGTGKIAEAVCDILFCLISTLVTFLCALAVDHGRLRFFQAALELVGGFSVVLALDPFLSGLAKKLYIIFCRIGAFFGKRLGFLVPHFKKKKRKKAKIRRKKNPGRKKAKKRA